ncbi:MAG: hypothetical protein WBG29_04605, partial [Candidatus Acidiferrales bacterium]
APMGAVDLVAVDSTVAGGLVEAGSAAGVLMAVVRIAAGAGSEAEEPIAVVCIAAAGIRRGATAHTGVWDTAAGPDMEADRGSAAQTGLLASVARSRMAGGIRLEALDTRRMARARRGREIPLLRMADGTGSERRVAISPETAESHRETEGCRVWEAHG